MVASTLLVITIIIFIIQVLDLQMSQEKKNSIHLKVVTLERRLNSLEPLDVICFLRSKKGLLVLSIPLIAFLLWYSADRIRGAYLDDADSFQWTLINIWSIIKNIAKSLLGIGILTIMMYRFWADTIDDMTNVDFRKFIRKFLILGRNFAIAVLLLVGYLFLMFGYLKVDFDKMSGLYSFLLITPLILFSLPSLLFLIPFSSGLLALIIAAIFKCFNLILKWSQNIVSWVAKHNSKSWRVISTLLMVTLGLIQAFLSWYKDIVLG